MAPAFASTPGVVSTLRLWGPYKARRQDFISSAEYLLSMKLLRETPFGHQPEYSLLPQMTLELTPEEYERLKREFLAEAGELSFTRQGAFLTGRDTLISEPSSTSATGSDEAPSTSLPTNGKSSTPSS